MTSTTKRNFDIDECMQAFFASPTHRLIMAMLAVHDKEITVDQALEYAKTGLITKGNDGK